MARRLSSTLGVVTAALVLLAWVSGVTVSDVGSGSTEPTMQTSSAAVTVPIAGSKAQVGKIYVYRSHGRLVVHGLVGHSGHDLLFRGDANITTDPPVDPGQVVDRVLFGLPGIGAAAHRLWQITPAVALLTGLGLAFSLRRRS